MIDDPWRYWREEIRHPKILPRDTPDPGSGYWRSEGAKTKYDLPFAIWTGEDGVRRVRVGASRDLEGEEAVLEFLSGTTWFRSVAVTHEDYQFAIANGKWPDGRRARSVTVNAPVLVEHLLATGDKDLLLYLRKRAESVVRKGETLPGIDEEMT
jgi:hypothetical protein